MAQNLIDTNLIIRFLVNDDPKKASQVEKLLRAKLETNILPDMVIAEIIWVLSSYYSLSKENIIQKIQALIHLETIQANQTLLDKSLSLWAEYNISFIDAYLAAMSELSNLKLYSYDQRLDSIKTTKRQEP